MLGKTALSLSAIAFLSAIARIDFQTQILHEGENIAQPQVLISIHRVANGIPWTFKNSDFGPNFQLTADIKIVRMSMPKPRCPPRKLGAKGEERSRPSDIKESGSFRKAASEK